MLEIKKRNLYVNVFDNINEFTKYLNDKPVKKGRDNSSQDVKTSGWAGTETYEEAIDLIKHGDDNLFEKLRRKSLN